MSHIRSSLSPLGVNTGILLAVLVAWGTVPCRGADNNDLLKELEFDSTNAASTLGTEVENPCSPLEKWSFQGTAKATIVPEARKEFALHLSGQRIPFSAYSEVIGRQPQFRSPEAVAFSLYWRARTLFSAKLYSQAVEAFDELISRVPNARTLPFQKAAIVCMDRIRDAAPHLNYSPKALGKLPQFYNPLLITEKDFQLLAKPALQYVFSQIQTGNHGAVNHALLLLEQSGDFEFLARAMWGLRERDMETASHYLTKLLTNTTLPPIIEARRNELRLLLASALYELEDYPGAISQLEAVTKRSNDLVDAISRLASAHLMQGNLTQAIGTAVILNSGDFRRTFVPEIYMVMAMGLNEMCRFPEAFSIVSDFKRQYLPSYRWLAARGENKGSNQSPLYPLTVRFLKKQPVNVPEKVLTEWVRSPVFLRLQQGINTVFQSTKSLPSLEYQVSLGIQQAGEELSEAQGRHKEAVADAKSTSDPEVEASSKAVVVAKARFQRLEQGRKHWTALLNAFRQGAEAQKANAVRQIESHLSSLNGRMFRQLTRVVENNELVEAEILTGVSRDIILSNAKGPEAGGQVRKPAHSRYKWSTGGEALMGIEVWEDEIGTMVAAVEDNCPNRKKKKGN